MNRKRLLTALAVIAVLIVAGFIKDGTAKFPIVNTVVLTIMRPFNYIAGGASHGLGKVGNFFSSSASLQEENAALLKENETLRKDNADLIGVKAENARLTQLLNFKNAHSALEVVTGKVISRDLGDFKDVLLIDKGTDDGLRINMSVITGSGLVGIIDGCYPHMSKVLLINSPRNRIGGMNLRGDSRVAGIVNGVAGSDMTLEMRNMARNADLLPGDTIVTSGYSGYHPAGIIIGNIEEVQMDEGGLTKKATIAPAVDFYKLEEVMVVTNYQGFSDILDEKGDLKQNIPDKKAGEKKNSKDEKDKKEKNDSEQKEGGAA